MCIMMKGSPGTLTQEDKTFTRTRRIYWGLSGFARVHKESVRFRFHEDAKGHIDSPRFTKVHLLTGTQGCDRSHTQRLKVLQARSSVSDYAQLVCSPLPPSVNPSSSVPSPPGVLRSSEEKGKHLYGCLKMVILVVIVPVFVCLCIRLSFSLNTATPVYLSLYVSGFRLSVPVSVYLSVRLSFFYISICSVYLSFYLLLCLTLCLYIIFPPLPWTRIIHFIFQSAHHHHHQPPSPVSAISCRLGLVYTPKASLSAIVLIQPFEVPPRRHGKQVGFLSTGW